MKKTAISSIIISYVLMISAVESVAMDPGGTTHASKYNREATDKKEAMFYQKLPSKKRVQCLLCPRKCILSDKERGECGVRKNIDGKLYSLVYGKPCSIGVEYIEKAPFYHFIPGHKRLCVATAGCNLRCIHCQNWQISQSKPESNGYINPAPLRKLIKVLDAVKIDLKGFTEEFYEKITSGDLHSVLRTLKILKEEGIHFEIVTLLIPTLNDSPEELKKMCSWIKENLGEDIPLHFTRFSPAYKLTKLFPTPIENIERAYNIAKATGLKYVYVGNVPGHEFNSTFCPKCNKLLIKRLGFSILEYNITEGKCKYCGEKIPGIWKK